MAVLGGKLLEIDQDSSETSVNPAFRDAVLHFVSWTEFESLDLTQELIDEHFTKQHLKMNKIRSITPGSGAYVNDCDYFEPDWETSLYGKNYDRLLEIK